jgi:hypothetical protein
MVLTFSAVFDPKEQTNLYISSRQFSQYIADDKAVILHIDILFVAEICYLYY